MKKWLFLICALMMSVACIGVAKAGSGYNPGEFVYEGSEGKATRCGDYRYVMLKDGTVEIVKYLGYTKMLEIPSKLDGKTVTSIGQEAFFGRARLTEVVIPNTITYIADRAFEKCSELGYISIPGSVGSIGDSAFLGCEKAAFLYIAPGVNSIGDYAFYFCRSMMVATLPNTISQLGEFAFGDCDSLTSFIIPDGVLNVTANTFYNCDRLTDIQVSAVHPTLENVDGVLFNKAEKCLVYYPCALKDKEYCIPEGTCSIANGAFCACSSLSRITIPDGITSIGESAFSDCTFLSSVVIPYGVTSIGSFTFYNCTFLSSVVIPDSVTSIDIRAFEGCETLISVNIPESVTQIFDDAFLNLPPTLTFTVTPGSYAEQYAIDHNIPCVYAAEATPAPDAEEGEAAPADASWTCACGSINDYSFCPRCGAARPVVEPTCSNCGYDPEGETPNFCPHCGNRF